MGYSFSKPEKNFGERFPVLYRSRYCDQEKFEIVAFSGEYNGKDICPEKPVLLSSFDTKEHLPSLTTNSIETIGCNLITLKRGYGFKSNVHSSPSKSVDNIKSIDVGGDIYLLYQHLLRRRIYSIASCYNSTSVKKFSSATKSWKNLPEIYDKKDFYCICSFLQKLYLVGNVSMYYDKHNNKMEIYCSYE